MNATLFVQIKKNILTERITDNTRLKGVIGDFLFGEEKLKSTLIWGVDLGIVSNFLKNGKKITSAFEKSQYQLLVQSGATTTQANCIITFCRFLIGKSTVKQAVNNAQQHLLSASFQQGTISTGITYPFEQIVKKYLVWILLFLLFVSFVLVSQVTPQQDREEMQKGQHTECGI